MSRTSRRNRYSARKEIRDGKAHGRNMTTPSWWNTLLNHRPNRRQARLAERLAAMKPEAAGDLLWPLSHKPHWYFW